MNISGTSRRKIEEELLSEPSDLVFDSAQSQVKPHTQDPWSYLGHC